MPRFVILAHDHPFPHWDLMLEAGGSLRTWRLMELPRPGIAIDADELGDHRIEYLTYEGPVSGGRGSVQRVDAGSFDWLETTDAGIVVDLYGTRHRGRLTMSRGEGRWKVMYSIADSSTASP